MTILRFYRIYEGAHNNLPDEASFNAAKEILRLCSQCDTNDLVIGLVSGGGSALLSLPVDGISIQDKREVSCLANSMCIIIIKYHISLNRSLIYLRQAFIHQ